MIELNYLPGGNYTGVCYVKPMAQKRWYVNGVLHREDGPAVIGDATKQWFVHGIRHRVDGPAVEFIDRNFSRIYYIAGDALNAKQFFEHHLVIKHTLESILNGCI